MSTTKHEKFVTLATNRVNKTLRLINLIGNLSNKASYEYTDDEVRKMFSALEGELGACKKRFAAASKTGGKSGFSFD